MQIAAEIAESRPKGGLRNGVCTQIDREGRRPSNVRNFSGASLLQVSACSKAKTWKVSSYPTEKLFVLRFLLVKAVEDARCAVIARYR
jgi:hypothetical protein